MFLLVNIYGSNSMNRVCAICFKTLYLPSRQKRIEKWSRMQDRIRTMDSLEFRSVCHIVRMEHNTTKHKSHKTIQISNLSLLHATNLLLFVSI